MATESANAARIANAQHQVDAHMDRIGRSLGFAPPPRGRADTRDARGAQDAERVAQFLQLVADSVDPSNVGKGVPTPQQLGGIGDGYNDSDEQQRKAAEKRRDALVAGLGAPEADDEAQSPAGGQPGGAEAEESPVSDTNADEAVEAVGRMRSREKLQHVIDNDKRASVKAAAQQRLTEL